MTPLAFDRPALGGVLPPSLRDMAGAAAKAQAPLWRRLWPRSPDLPSASPWGAVIEANEVAPGVVWFKTASRGGYRLSKRRQAALPRYLRTEDGWYEDRTEWAAVAVVFDRIFDATPPGVDAQNTLYQIGRDTLMNWRPEEFERWFQTSLEMDVILGLSIMRFYRQNTERWIAIDILDDRHAFVPRGRLYVRAKQGGDPPFGAATGLRPSPSRWFVVDAREFVEGRGKPFLIDPARHVEVPAPGPSTLSRLEAFHADHPAPANAPSFSAKWG